MQSVDAACPLPENEASRLSAVHALEVLDTAPELEFDALARVAAHAFDMPIAVVALMDAERLWFKSRLGLDLPQLDRRVAFCAHALMRPREALVVPDLREDSRFHANPLVVEPPHLRFYAGAPIVDPAGHALGTIAVIDAQPRSFSAAQHAILLDLSHLAMGALHARHRALEASRLAMTDHLTKIANRACFDEMLEAELDRAARTGRAVGVLCMDLDRFKSVNDSLGHAAGDELLCIVAQRLAHQVRQGDLLARLGGDEFGIVLRDADEAATHGLAQRIAAAVKEPVALSSGVVVQVGIAIGSAIGAAEPGGQDAGSARYALLSQADRAMYEAKRRGRG